MALNLPLRPWRPSCKSRRRLLSELQQLWCKRTEVLVRGLYWCGACIVAGLVLVRSLYWCGACVGAGLVLVRDLS